MPKLGSAKSLLQLCLERISHQFRISGKIENNRVETTSTVDSVSVEEENELVTKYIANPFEQLHPTLLAQVIDNIGELRNIKHLDLLITTRTRKWEKFFGLKDKHDSHYVLQLAASRCLKLEVLILRFRREKCPLEYAKKFLHQFKHLQVLKVFGSRENFDDSCLHLIGIHCIDLRELDMSSCNVTDYGIQELCGGTILQPGEDRLKGPSHGQYKSIQELSIRVTKITVKGVQMALLHLPDLKTLKSSFVIEALRASHQNVSLICAKYALRKLVFELFSPALYFYQSGDFRLVASRCLLVTHLELEINVGITDSDLLDIVLLEDLRYLKLSYCDPTDLLDYPICYITFDGGLAPLLQARGHSLKSLELKNIPESVPVHLTVFECCRNLKRLLFHDICLAPGRLEEDEWTSRPSKRIKSDFVLNFEKEEIF